MIRNSLGLSSMLSHGMQPCDKQPLFYRCSHWGRVWDPRAGSNGSRVGSGRGGRVLPRLGKGRNTKRLTHTPTLVLNQTQSACAPKLTSRAEVTRHENDDGEALGELEWRGVEKHAIRGSGGWWRRACRRITAVALWGFIRGFKRWAGSQIRHGNPLEPMTTPVRKFYSTKVHRVIDFA